MWPWRGWPDDAMTRQEDYITGMAEGDVPVRHAAGAFNVQFSTKCFIRHSKDDKRGCRIAGGCVTVCGIAGGQGRPRRATIVFD